MCSWNISNFSRTIYYLNTKFELLKLILVYIFLFNDDSCDDHV